MRIDRRPAEEEVRRLVRLQPGRGGVDAEIGDQAVEGRHGRQHPRRKTGSANTRDRLVPRKREDAGMSVNDDAYACPTERRRDDRLDDLRVCLTPRLRRAVEVVERSSRVGFNASTRRAATGSGEQVEDLVGTLDRPARCGCQLRDGVDAGADNG